jgi:hypothetical protein
VLTAAVNLLWTIGTASAVVVPILGLIWVGMMRRDSPAKAPGPEEPPGSGIVLRTEVTAVWIPRALLDVAQGEAGAPVFRSPDAPHTELKRRGLNDMWYSITYRHHQVNGEFGELT